MGKIQVSAKQIYILAASLDRHMVAFGVIISMKESHRVAQSSNRKAGIG